jgi:hypothetical protein
MRVLRGPVGCHPRPTFLLHVVQSGRSTGTPTPATPLCEKICSALSLDTNVTV